MANGILIVDKPEGWTSQDVTAKLRGVFRERRIGHGGTLDPMATGVLPVFVGRATRAVEFFESAEKEYIADLRLGMVTNTQDTQGELLSQCEASVTRRELEAVLETFLGEQQQIPPMFSAIKIGGKKLYELARQGKEIARPARTVVIRELELLEGAGDRWRFRVRCGKGTYVRTLCHDVGQRLGCGGCMAALRRSRAGMFDLSAAIPLAEILSAEAPETLLLPVERMFSYPKVTLTAAQEKRCRNGAAIAPWHGAEGRVLVYGASGDFLMVGEGRGGTLNTVKSFFEVE